MTIIYAHTAIDELQSIWHWNFLNRGEAQADKYLGYLTANIEKLALTCAKGKVVDVRPDLRYATFRMRAKSHGHIVVYKFNDNEVRILHVFHTAQDWLNRLADELL